MGPFHSHERQAERILEALPATLLKKELRPWTTEPNTIQDMTIERLDDDASWYQLFRSDTIIAQWHIPFPGSDCRGFGNECRAMPGKADDLPQGVERITLAEKPTGTRRAEDLTVFKTSESDVPHPPFVVNERGSLDYILISDAKSTNLLKNQSYYDKFRL